MLIIFSWDFVGASFLTKVTGEGGAGTDLETDLQGAGVHKAHSINEGTGSVTMCVCVCHCVTVSVCIAGIISLGNPTGKKETLQ